MQVKIAESATPTINMSKKPLCRFGCRFVSNMERKMRPMPPTTDPNTARTLKTLSRRRIVGISLEITLVCSFNTRIPADRPECRRYRSITRDKKNVTACKASNQFFLIDFKALRCPP